jgi:hypothetical protein
VLYQAEPNHILIQLIAGLCSEFYHSLRRQPHGIF